MAIPGFAGAPLAAATVAGSALASVFASLAPRATNRIPVVGLVPPLGVFSSPDAALWVYLLLFQVRPLERLRGSGRFFLLSAWPTVVFSIVARVAHYMEPTPMTELMLDRATLTASAGWCAMGCALGVRYVSDVPAKNKWVVLLLLAKLVIYDSGTNASSRREAGVNVTASMVGLVVGLLLDDGILGKPLLRFLDNAGWFNRLEDFFGSLLCGGRYFVKHASPRPPEDEGTPHAGAAAGGEDDPELRAAIAASLGGGGAVPPAAAAGANRGAAPPLGGHPGQRRRAAPRPAVALDPAAVQLLLGLGTGCSQADAEQALAACRGDVDAAAAVLMDQTR